MAELSVHYVDGVGRQILSDDRPFHPQAYEQAIHGLQRIILAMCRRDNYETVNAEPDHQLVEAENGEPHLLLDENSLLFELCKYIIPHQWGWDVSVVDDQIREYSYGLRASVDCGGGVIVRCTVFVEAGQVRRFDIAHHMIHDPEEIVRLDSFGPSTSSREVCHLIRWLERTVMSAYAAEISSGAKAYDYTATKEDIPPSGGREPVRRNKRERVYQSEWATIRDKTAQTISDNVRDARGELESLPDPSTYFSGGQALEQQPPNCEYVDGDIRLV